MTLTNSLTLSILFVPVVSRASEIQRVSTYLDEIASQVLTNDNDNSITIDFDFDIDIDIDDQFNISDEFDKN